jgi:hypothetical protein
MARDAAEVIISVVGTSVVATGVVTSAAGVVTTVGANVEVSVVGRGVVLDACVVAEMVVMSSVPVAKVSVTGPRVVKSPVWAKVVSTVVMSK